MMTSTTERYTRFEIEVAGGQVNVLKGGTGPALLLIHDDIGSQGWSEFNDQLARSFTVYAPDLPGYGASSRPEWARNVRDLVALTGLTLDALGLESVTVVGLGFGGWIAAELASYAQPRFGRIVLSAPMGLIPSEGEIYDDEGQPEL